MSKLNKEESIKLFKRLKKADDEQALTNILRITDSYIGLFELLEIFDKLKKGEPVEIDVNVMYLLNKGLKNWEDIEKEEAKDITVTVKGFNTIEEASEFCSWYSGQGESDASIWFDCRVAEGVINSSYMDEESTYKTNKNNIEMILKMQN